MSSDNKNGCTQPNNEKSINPYVTVKGNVLVSDCCGVEAVYRVSNECFDLWPFCPACLENYPLEWLEVKHDFDNEIHLNNNDEFEIEGYDKNTFEIIPKCHSKTYTKEELKNMAGCPTSEYDTILEKNNCFYCKKDNSLLSFKLVGQTINKNLNNLKIKVCEDCYFTNESELKEVE